MRRYQTRLAGGIVIGRATPSFNDHVALAISNARQGRRVWIKSLSGDVPRDQDLDRFYAIEFRDVDGHMQITCYEQALVINPNHPFSPPWMADVCNYAHRILNTNSNPGGEHGSEAPAADAC